MPKLSIDERLRAAETELELARRRQEQEVQTKIIDAADVELDAAAARWTRGNRSSRYFVC
jgi:uncharacterized membrane-anchored protein